MAKSDKLKKLITKLGGTAPETDSISDCLDALCDCEIGGGGGLPIFAAQIHWDDMNGAYALDTPASEILEACRTGLCVLVDTAYNGARTYYWQAFNNNSPLATFMGVDYANKKIVEITVKPDRVFAEREEAIFG